jgi:nitrous oxide reductase accessory protein NosL
MKIIWMILVLCLLLSGGIAVGAADKIEPPESCEACGMDRAIFAKSRMVVVYADGTSTGVCSLYCAVATMKQNSGRQVKSLLVADYATARLIDARSAVWVLGGTQEGVMTPLPKWAFGGAEAARNFVKENGGRVVAFDEVMKVARGEAETEAVPPHDHHGHHDHMGSGAQMIFNPAFGDDIYHTHPAGMWMVGYRYMHTDMGGLRAGTANVPVTDVIPMKGTRYGYMMAPTGMTMDMHMLMVMYGLTDRLTLMGMVNYQDNAMDMLMNMGMGKGNRPEPTMRTSGLGDTELRGIYRITDHLVGSLGIGIPTGNITQEFTTMGMKFRAPYDMQLGSGTVDIKPALTCNVLSDDAAWNWGGQVAYTNHLGRNDAGYSLGDTVKVTGWLQRALGPASVWLRLAYGNTGRIKGRDGEIQKLLDPVMGASTPDADPGNYGGQRLDGLVGVSYARGPVSVGVEGGVPLYQDLNGLQLETNWFLTAGFQVMF